MSTKKTKSNVLSADEKRKAKEEARRLMITQSEIFERGWTRSMVAKFLPEPALTKRNLYNFDYPIKLWMVTTVEEAEKTDMFREALKKSKIRRAAAIKGHITRAENEEKSDYYCYI